MQQIDRCIANNSQRRRRLRSVKPEQRQHMVAVVILARELYRKRKALLKNSYRLTILKAEIDLWSNFDERKYGASDLVAMIEHTETGIQKLLVFQVKIVTPSTYSRSRNVLNRQLGTDYWYYTSKWGIETHCGGLMLIRDIHGEIRSGEGVLVFYKHDPVTHKSHDIAMGRCYTEPVTIKKW